MDPSSLKPKLLWNPYSTLLLSPQGVEGLGKLDTQVARVQRAPEPWYYKGSFKGYYKGYYKGFFKGLCKGLGFPKIRGTLFSAPETPEFQILEPLVGSFRQMGGITLFWGPYHKDPTV